MRCAGILQAAPRCPSFALALPNSGCRHDTLLTPGGGGGQWFRAAETPAGSSQAGERGEAVRSSLILSRRGLAPQGVEEAGEDHTKKPERGVGIFKLFLAPPTQTLLELLFSVGLMWNPFFLPCFKVGSRRHWLYHLSQSVSGCTTCLSSPGVGGRCPFPEQLLSLAHPRR